MTAKEMFEKLGYEYYYSKDKEGNVEDTIHYTLKNKMKLQFNIESKIVVLTDLSNSEDVYINPTLFINKDLLKAINKQIEELGWNNET